MILADTSVWINHLARPIPGFAELLGAAEISMHPYVIGELALGSLRDRRSVLALFARLPRCPLASVAEVAALIEWHKLASCGIGYVDAHLIASAKISPGARLWTHDKQLRAQAERLGVAADLE